MAPGRPVRFDELTWPGIAELIDGGETLALLPVGATEQHGRHLPASTDAEIATAVCHAASARTGVPVLPTVRFGSSQGHTTKWPRKLALPTRLLAESVFDLGRRVGGAGFSLL